MREVLILPAALLAAWGPPAAAESPVPDSGHVLVTATRTPLPLDEVLASAFVIDRDAIERSVAVDATELLRFHAGLELGRNGGPGQTTAIFIRGAESNHTLVLVDGVRINPGTIGLAALQNLSPSLIERIEIVKGPRSALYGTDAIGGVVNVVTRPGAVDGWSVEAGYGDYETRQASLNAGFGDDRLAFDVGVSWLDSAGFPTRTTDDTDRGYENLGATAQLRARLGEADVSARHWRSEGTSEYSDFFLTPVDQDYLTSTTSLQAALPLGQATRGQFTVSRLEDRIEQNQSDDDLRTERDTVDVQFDRAALGVHVLGAGVQYARERADSTSFGERMRADTDLVNAYLQDRIVAGPHRALLALGYADHETAGDAVTWNAEYGYVFDGTMLYGLAGTGFRAPDATDRYGFGGNPDLEPERSRNVEAGVRHRVGDRHAFGLAAFRNDIDDLIEFVTLSFEPFEGENRNVEAARIEGVEASYEYDAAPWYARVEAIHQDPRNRDTDERLFRRARDSVTVSLLRSLGAVRVGLDVLATGDRKDFGFPEPVTLDGYVLANLTASWQATPALALSVRVENLLDEQYELAHTFNTPDRGLYVSMRYAPGAAQVTTVARRDAAPAPGAYSLAGGTDRRESPWVTD
ncbi:MAG: TonB-dependent receptor [Lysobacterales bacterium]|nr:MAG: TonB-dependent receptor [Xanthomonadales bacterium]